MKAKKATRLVTLTFPHTSQRETKHWIKNQFAVSSAFKVKGSKKLQEVLVKLKSKM